MKTWDWQLIIVLGLLALAAMAWIVNAPILIGVSVLGLYFISSRALRPWRAKARRYLKMGDGPD